MVGAGSGGGGVVGVKTEEVVIFSSHIFISCRGVIIIMLLWGHNNDRGRYSM